MRILHVVGARPNFVKLAPIMQAIEPFPDRFEQFLIHTGQHHDISMSQVFFQELELPQPHVNLGVGSGSHAQQTAQVMLAFESVVQELRPDLVLVVGDVNSTLACALTCAKLGVRIAHVEAGLRSFDRTMPEEINRVLTDQLAELLFTPSRDADANLRREGIADTRIFFVGNVMIDNLVHCLPKARSSICAELGTSPQNYALVTLHRPSNVDDPIQLHSLLDALAHISTMLPVIFPMHPRTRQRIADLDFGALIAGGQNLHVLEPLGYLDFLPLMRDATVVITDSGGIQEETTWLGVPCLTVRPNTERNITIEVGTNQLVRQDRASITQAVTSILNSGRKRGTIPELWDGHAAERIVQVLLSHEVS